MIHSHDFIVIGAGIFGVTTALTLRARGFNVAILDPGPLPHPLAESTDISKVVRVAYGADEQYMRMADEAIDGWHSWNQRFGQTLYHEVGTLHCLRQPMHPGGDEATTFALLQKHGFAPQRLSADDIARQWPAWNTDVYIDGFFLRRGGYAESGRVVATLVEQARQQGVVVHEKQTATQLVYDKGYVTGVQTREGEHFSGGHCIVCAGSWTPFLLPELQPIMHISGQPVFHIRPRDPALFTVPNFTVFAADVVQTGWYGLPFHPREQVVKIANHRVATAVHPEHSDRLVTDADVTSYRAFVAEAFPALAADPIVFTRLCLYSNTSDGDFLIDRHPEWEGLTLATGGSGHAFKMAPILGQLITAAALGEKHRWLHKFRWRVFAPDIT